MSVEGSGTGAGGLFGEFDVTDNYNNFHFGGAVSGGNKVGGIFGIFTGTITPNAGNSITSFANVTGNNDVGGIVGEIASGGVLTAQTITVGNTPQLTLNPNGSNLGGIAGDIFNGGTLRSSSTSGVLQADATTTNIGGAVGAILGNNGNRSVSR